MPKHVLYKKRFSEWEEVERCYDEITVGMNLFQGYDTDSINFDPREKHWSRVAIQGTDHVVYAGDAEKLRYHEGGKDTPMVQLRFFLGDSQTTDCLDAMFSKSEGWSSEGCRIRGE